MLFAFLHHHQPKILSSHNHHGNAPDVSNLQTPDSEPVCASPDMPEGPLRADSWGLAPELSSRSGAISPAGQADSEDTQPTVGEQDAQGPSLNEITAAAAASAAAAAAAAAGGGGIVAESRARMPRMGSLNDKLWRAEEVSLVPLG